MFDLETRLLTPAPQPVYGLMPARTEAPGISVTGWVSTKSPALNGQPLVLRPLEEARSLAIAPDGSSFVLGASWYLRLYDPAGTLLQEPVSLPAPAWGTSYSSDGRLVVVAIGDGTIRWYRARDLQELLALFIHADGNRWVAWTPSGYYAAGPGAEDLIGWHVNNGEARAAEFYSASRFRKQLHRPDVVELVLDTLDEAKAVRHADAMANRRPTGSFDLMARLPPMVDIIAPDRASGFDGPDIMLKFRVRSPADTPVTAVNVLVNGRPVVTAPARNPIPGEGWVDRLRIPLPPQDVTVSVFAETAAGSGPVVSLPLRWMGPAPSTAGASDKPRLKALLVGVSAYDNPADRLELPAKDARDLAAALENQAGGLYHDVTVKALPDANRDAIMDGLDWLVHATGPGDIGLIFLSGRGVNDDRDQFWFMPRDGDRARLRSTAIPTREIDDALARLPGKGILFVDTSAATGVATGSATTDGPVDVNSLINALSGPDRGVVVFASASGRQTAWEEAAWSNGAFVRSLLDALSGPGADGDGDGGITLTELDRFLVERIGTLTGGRQNPVMVKPSNVPDIPIAAVQSRPQ